MVDKTENPENLKLDALQGGSAGSPDDIPEAQRESIPARPSSRRSQVLWGLIGLSAIAGIGAELWAGQPMLRSSTTDDVEPVSASATAAPQATATPLASPSPETAVDTILGHRAYEEAPLGDLTPIVADGSIKLRTAAAQKFSEMVADAQADGVIIVPLSGFRSYDDQRYLFFDVKAERGQTAERRAEVSAPPGYSEHHTGYAVDIVDGNRPETDLQESFETTVAFQWMQQNAAYYGFELSFPKNNPQGIQYEPWHWRFVGDPASLETFYKDQPQSQSVASPQPETAP